MRRLTPEEVIEILSQTHLINTAIALNKEPHDVTAEELVQHWLNFHPATIVKFQVDDTEMLFV